ncbi:hypothetical protein D088_890017 [Salmonella enterica subsp. houtenae serovar 16:z4,z32:-- str. RKS3027]|nr:hypothetical protein D088_890017 [Salmonella enterica subsp. houtenae serovar 16:z4,z32:-- str. RKS3027]
MRSSSLHNSLSNGAWCYKVFSVFAWLIPFSVNGVGACPLYNPAIGLGFAMTHQPQSHGISHDG